MTAQKSNQPEKPSRFSRRGKVVTTLAGLGMFVAGAIASPALEDTYEWVRGLTFGKTVSETQVRQLNVVNYDGTLSSDYRVDQIVQGSCIPGSIVGANPNGYRCVFKNHSDKSYVIDPCFAMNNGVSVACVTAPWDRTALQINLNEPVDFNLTYVSFGQEKTPWALELKDPRHPRETWHCMTLTGATAPIAGNQPKWWCQNGKTQDARALNDLIVSDGNVWKVLFAHPEESELVEADITVAWY